MLTVTWVSFVLADTDENVDYDTVAEVADVDDVELQNLGLRKAQIGVMLLPFY